MSTGAAPITDQAGVNAAGSFDAAADSLLDLSGANAGADANDAKAGAVGDKSVEVGETGDAGVQADAVKSAAAGTEAKDAQAVQGNVDEWAIDQAAIDRLLADPTHGAIVKQLADQRAKLLGYRDHWSLEEAREARSLAPGGIEELRQTVKAAQDARAENAEFASGEPARQATALKSIAEDMPEAFAAGVAPYLDTLKSVNPEAYNATVGKLASEALAAEGLPEMIGSHFAAIEAMARAAEKGDEKAFAEAFQAVVGAPEFRAWAQKVGIGAQAAPAKARAVDPEVAKLQKELEGYKAKEQQAAQESATQIQKEFGEFTQSVDAAWQKLAQPEVDKLLEVIPSNMPKVAREQLTTRLGREIVGELQNRINDELVKGLGDLARKIDAVVTNRAWKTNADRVREQVANLVNARAKQLLPHVAKPILDAFSTATVAAAKERAERDDANASRTDIRGGASGPKAAGPVKVEDVRSGGKFSRMTDEEILGL